MEATSPYEQPHFVLSNSVVGWGIESLQSQAIHSFFTAYLFIRRQGVLQNSKEVEPDWRPLDDFLSVPGGPPEKPWFRPFNQQTDTGAHDWMRAHPAGSWNTSSVRTGTPGALVLAMRGKAFLLENGHSDLALEHLLYGEPAPVLAIATFLYRDYAFVSDSPAIGPANLIELFRRDFYFREGSDDREFETLFDASIPDRHDWFEPWNQSAQAEARIE